MYSKYNYMYMRESINFYFSETLTNTCEHKIKKVLQLNKNISIN